MTLARNIALSGDPQQLMKRSHDLLDGPLRRSVGRLHPELSAVASYHFGWTTVNGTPDTAGRTGKAIRSALACLSAEAVGADAKVAIPGAVAVELVHNYSILHDDVMDGELMRRHRPTAWSVFGVGLTVLAGDALVALVSGELIGIPGSRGSEAVNLVGSTVEELILGQAEDLTFERRGDVGLQEYVHMANHKTAALMGCSLSIGALLAGAPARTVKDLALVGRKIGLAFQVMDDLLGIWGSAERTGKSVSSDLARRKKTFPVVAALEAGVAESDELADIYAGDATDHVTLNRIARLIELAGGRDRANAEIERQLDAALTVVAADISEQSKAELEGLASFLASRSA
ncbi:MAG: polyprenyl synthetase family protein [Actinomycetota bacterium]